MADLYINKDAFNSACNKLKKCSSEMSDLCSSIEASFEQLRKDWNSEAGEKFFSKFEDELMKNLKNYVSVFEYMSINLSTASSQYDEVFRAADKLANTDF